MSPPAIPCPSCSVPLVTPDVLDAGTVAIPDLSVLQFRCPHCRAGAWARLGDGHVALGPVGGEPGDFDAACEPALSVRPDAGWLDCWYAGQYRRFPARIAARVA
ncbi:hypothetical protein [Anaeromyxobacter oryzae]|uniref:hypothetical protein n=1 Tax=Anaeromyxobacter oryzae TaxID=2918170 RepID=UPI0020C0CF8F|nr:hypothetical protein [Anaeromyxobacter oryzae]